MTDTTELPSKTFASAKAWEAWLSKHCNDDSGLWIQIAKKASNIPTVTHDEALNVALCYGWIDGQRNSFDDKYFLQKFTPRRSKSLWSKRNIAKVTQLIEAGKMQPSGKAEIEAAQQDGRWQAAYDSQKDMVIPEDFLKAVQQHEKAKAFLETLNRTNIYAIAWRLQTAKTPATRERRFVMLLEMLKKGQKFH